MKPIQFLQIDHNLFHNVLRLGVAGVGISKPIRYFELKTEIFNIFVLQSFLIWEMLHWDSLNSYHENIMRVI